MNKQHFSRRQFFQGVGGTLLAAPFLSSIGKRAAFAQPAVQKRLIVMFTHYGCLTNRWFPTVSHGSLIAPNYEPTTLKHLAPYADKLLMPRGIRAMNEWSFTAEYGQETSAHIQAMGSLFTCCPIDGWSGLGDMAALGIREDVPIRQGDGRPVGGRSLDHVCAEQLSPNGSPLLLGVGRVAEYELNNFSYRTAGSMSTRAEMFLPNNSASSAYSEVMAGGAALDTSSTLYNFVRTHHALDLVRDDLLRIQAKTLGTSDKQKLEAWASLLTETEGQVRQCDAATIAALNTTPEDLQTTSNDLQVTARAMLNIAILSALCEHNPVGFVKFPGNAGFDFLGVTGDSDSVSHRVGGPFAGGDCATDINEKIALIDDWYAQQFASLVGTLDAIEEGDGRLLDNCAAVWFQEVSDGGAQNLNNFPILQAGSCGGYFKTGVAVNVDDGAADLTPGNSEHVCSGDLMTFTGEQGDLAGTPPELANAPINKYFCNLMNALGMRAGADGFPAVGGEAEVTHFGYYDNTKDFASFLTAEPLPPSINSPGGFDALRANS